MGILNRSIIEGEKNVCCPFFSSILSVPHTFLPYLDMNLFSNPPLTSTETPASRWKPIVQHAGPQWLISWRREGEINQWMGHIQDMPRDAGLVHAVAARTRPGGGGMEGTQGGRKSTNELAQNKREREKRGKRRRESGENVGGYVRRPAPTLPTRRKVSIRSSSEGLASVLFPPPFPPPPPFPFSCLRVCDLMASQRERIISRIFLPSNLPSPPPLSQSVVFCVTIPSPSPPFDTSSHPLCLPSPPLAWKVLAAVEGGREGGSDTCMRTERRGRSPFVPSCPWY